MSSAVQHTSQNQILGNPKTRADVRIHMFNPDDPAHVAALGPLMQQQAATHGYQNLNEDNISDLVNAVRSKRLRTFLVRMTDRNSEFYDQYIGLMNCTAAFNEKGYGWHLEDIVVHEKFRDQDIGTTALDQLKELASSLNLYGIKWYVQKTNALAQGMYEKFSENHYPDRSYVRYFPNSSVLLNAITSSTAPTIRKAKEKDVSKIVNLMVRKLDWDRAQAELTVRRAVSGNTNDFSSSRCYVAQDRGNGINSVIIASDGLSTFRSVSTVQAFMVFSTRETARLNLAPMLQIVAADQKRLGRGETLYVDIDHFSRTDQTHQIVEDALAGIGAEVLKYADVPMLSGALSTRDPVAIGKAAPKKTASGNLVSPPFLIQDGQSSEKEPGLIARGMAFAGQALRRKSRPVPEGAAEPVRASRTEIKQRRKVPGGSGTPSPLPA